MSSAIEADFHAAMLHIYDAAAELGYRPTYFLRMVQQRGGPEAARQLLDTPAPSEGFTRLWELGRLDLSVEAVVLREEFRLLFTEHQVEVARRRLAEYRYQG